MASKLFQLGTGGSLGLGGEVGLGGKVVLAGAPEAVPEAVDLEHTRLIGAVGAGSAADAGGGAAAGVAGGTGWCTFRSSFATVATRLVFAMLATNRKTLIKICLWVKNRESTKVPPNNLAQHVSSPVMLFHRLSCL